MGLAPDTTNIAGNNQTKALLKSKKKKNIAGGRLFFSFLFPLSATYVCSYINNFVLINPRSWSMFNQICMWFLQFLFFIYISLFFNR